MINLTRLNGAPFIVNSDLIEHIEVAPDTIITLTTGQKYMVQESAQEVVHRVTDFRRSLLEKGPPVELSDSPGALAMNEDGSGIHG